MKIKKKKKKLKAKILIRRNQKENLKRLKNPYKNLQRKLINKDY